jgi:hypothetical protein
VKRFLLVAVVLAAGATALYLVIQDDDPGPPRDVVLRIDAEAAVCWTALLAPGEDPSAEPRSEADCGARELPFSAGDRGNAVVSKVGDAGQLSVAVVVNGAETQRRSTTDPRGTVVLEL